LRIGLAAAQAVAMVTGKLVIPVSTMHAIAAAWRLGHSAVATQLMACLDGARGDVFYALFDFAADSSDLRLVVPPSVGSPEDAAKHVGRVAGGSALVIAGNGVSRYGKVIGEALAHAVLDADDLNLAAGAALVAARSPDGAVAPHALRPQYVRRPDAVLARERAREKDATHANLKVVCSASAGDLAGVAELQRQSFSKAWGADALQWELDNTAAARLYTVRDESGTLVAYCACWFVVDELHINSLAVEPSRRREGIARWLLRRVLEDASAAGARSATLEVRQSNAAARALYEGLGFRVEGIRRDYYEEPREDALILWRRGLGRVAAG
jgi:ribosomal-protein-alanine N-acetyltransferase